MSFAHHLRYYGLTLRGSADSLHFLWKREEQNAGWPLIGFLAEFSAQHLRERGCLPPSSQLLSPAPPSRAHQGGSAARRARVTDGRTWVTSYLCLALMCICRPLRLEALCPHSSQTNSFSPRCLKASCRRSSVRDRKHLEQVEHCKATGERGVRQLARARFAAYARNRPAHHPRPVPPPAAAALGPSLQPAAAAPPVPRCLMR